MNVRNCGQIIKNNKILLFLICGFIGAIIFIMIYGVRILNPTYDDWLLTSGDLTQHYMGWKFYRNSDWQFHIGLIQGLSYDDVSIMYTDSIPLFALFFKLISPLLPSCFQYFGLWGITCFFLQGGVSSLIVRKFTDNTYLCAISSIFFILSSVVLTRLYGHEALAGNWIILVGLAILIYSKDFKSYKTTALLWIFISVISVMVHAYLTAMIFIIMFGYFIYDFLNNKKIIRSFITLTISITLVLIIMYFMGAFCGNNSFSDYGLGVYNSNLNTFFNSYIDSDSKYLKPIGVVSSAQWEGHAYLGFGMLLACFLAFLMLLSYVAENRFKYTLKKIKNNYTIYISVLIICFISMFLAVCPVVTLNGRTLITFSYPEFITKLLSVFRASGRFIWITFYIIQIVSLIIIIKYCKKKTAAIIISLCMLFQVTDFSKGLNEKSTQFLQRYEYISPLKDDKWIELGRNCDHIVFTALPGDYLKLYDMFYSFAEFADKYSLTLSSFYLARSDINEVVNLSYKALEDVNTGDADKKTIYVFVNEKPTNGSIRIFEIDGYTIGVV